ncbi:hypothetical protein ILUMI_00308 [Ignelater luminosus]|uniref:K Homology domain-containing protein n=1 Tax=Ignelater luminosus TaxID=2038154 RepID=A0A8K0DLV8_IGNLU|nr:hypothetical protein ILUMI_00308 [Ignelater luminosus]
MAADSGMDTCPSPEIADSRKRPLDGDNENGDTKRSHFSTGGDGTYHFKVLVPSVAAGAIIGKGGETIAQLQKDTGARVKMSKSHDFYPGTTERVCLITGTIDAIMAVMEFIMEKIREKPDLSKPLVDGADSKLMQDRDKQVKILVPNSTAGMIIGKAGNYIKQIKETSGSYVQISQKAKDMTLQERCITVIGEKEANKQACMMILAKVVEDPQSGTCLNVSYADVSGPVANYNPTGSPYAQNTSSAFNASTTSLNSGLSSVSQSLMLNGGLNLSLNLNAPGQNMGTITAQLLDSIKLTLRNSGYTESQMVEICAALSVLAKYGILAMGLGLSGAHAGALPVSNYLSVMDQAGAATANTGVFGPIGQVSLGECLGATSPTPRSNLERYDTAFDPFRHQSSPAAAPISINNNSFGLGTGQQMAVLSKSPTPAELQGKDSKNVEIAEVIVGAILGPGGRSLVEIQNMSGANIQISKKGIFAPGTRNRIVTITGNPNAINAAQYLIEQRISEEEIKRARNNTLSTLGIQ